jgi:superfamily II DNA/RNA helicase
VLQFRNGLKNLMISTNVLEEGIDLPACHLVISFDSPDNITSFIQRRGRARQGVSEFVVMEASDDKLIISSSKQYGNLERQMQDICLDHQRSHPVSGMDDKQPDKFFLQLRLYTGFASHVSKLSGCQLTQVNILQSPVNQRERYNPSVPFLHIPAR